MEGLDFMYAPAISNKNKIMSKWIMECNSDGPVAGKVIEICQPQYPGQEVSYKVSWIEGYEGWLDEGSYVEFDKDKWDCVLSEWNKILVAKENIRNILKI